jgi:hypothetical protein
VVSLERVWNGSNIRGEGILIPMCDYLKKIVGQMGSGLRRPIEIVPLYVKGRYV